MKILIVCMMLYQQLQLAEPSTRQRRWQEDQQQQQQQEQHQHQYQQHYQQQQHHLYHQHRHQQQAEQSIEPETVEMLVKRSSFWTDNLDNRLPLTVLERSPEQTKRIAASENLTPAWIRISARSTCSCESQYVIRDLGDGHYPRYLTASHCKPKTCQSKFHSCRLLYYMVHVLRPREATTLAKDWNTNDSVLPETPLPESLRSKWKLQPISVAVACISSSENRRN